MRKMKVACYRAIRMLNPDQVFMAGNVISIQEFYLRVHNVTASACDNRCAGRHEKIHGIVPRVSSGSMTNCLSNPETPPYFIRQNVKRCLLCGEDTAVRR